MRLVGLFQTGSHNPDIAMKYYQPLTVMLSKAFILLALLLSATSCVSLFPEPPYRSKTFIPEADQSAYCTCGKIEELQMTDVTVVTSISGKERVCPPSAGGYSVLLYDPVRSYGISLVKAMHENKNELSVVEFVGGKVGWGAEGFSEMLVTKEASGYNLFLRHNGNQNKEVGLRFQGLTAKCVAEIEKLTAGFFPTIRSN